MPFILKIGVLVFMPHRVHTYIWREAADLEVPPHAKFCYKKIA